MPVSVKRVQSRGAARFAPQRRRGAVKLAAPSRLVGNPEIERYMRGRHPEILDEFRAIIAAASLDRSVAGLADPPQPFDPGAPP